MPPTPVTLDLGTLAPLVGALPDGVLVVDAHGTIVFVNERLEQLSGRAAGELVGSAVESLVPASRRSEHVTSRRRFQRDPSLRPMGVGVDARLLRADGTAVPVDIQLSPVRLGDTVYSVAAVRDATERRQMETALRESEARWRMLVERSPVMVTTVSPDGYFTSINPAFERVTGFRRDEWIGRHYSGVVHPDDVTSAGLRVQGATAGLAPSQGTARLLTRSGEYRVVESTVVPLVEEGTVTGALSVSRDVTDVHRAEARLRQSEERFRMVFEHSPLGIMLVALDGTVSAVNESMARFLGSTPGELVGVPLGDVMHPDDVAAAGPYAERLLAGEVSSYQVERRYCTSDGREVVGNVTVSLVAASDDEPRHGIQVVEDVTARKVLAAERRARRATARAALATLTTREAEVLELATEGITAREIAERLVVSVRTVESHLAGAYRKLATSSRSEAADRYRQLRRAASEDVDEMI